MDKLFSSSNLRLIFLLVLAWAVCPCAVQAESASDLTLRGNKLFHEDQMNDSIEEYLRALELDPTSPLIQYNLGTALAQQGEILKSEKGLNQAAEQSHGKLRRDSLFNLGVSLADEQGSAGAPSGMPPGMMGLTLPQANSTGGAPTDKAADSAGQLKRSLEAFRNAILTDPADQEAKHNYELTLAKLRNQQQQQQQQQDQGESGGDESSSTDQQQGESGSQGLQGGTDIVE